MQHLKCPEIIKLNDVIYVAKNGNDSNSGTIGDPFQTIGAANDYAITLLSPVTDWEESVVINVGPGVYTEHIADAHRRIFIQGPALDLENWDKSVIIYNTGADVDHYPIDPGYGLNLTNIQVTVDSDGVFGKLINKFTCTSCVFYGGHFIENLDSAITQYFNFCFFGGGKGFDLSGIANHMRFIAFRYSDLATTNPIFGSSGTGDKEVKWQNSLMGANLSMKGDWSTLMQGSEIYGANGKLTFDTDGYVEIFSSAISNGIHFTSDTALSKKVVNCIFWDTPSGEADITADVSVAFLEYSGNHQDHGIDGEVITVSKIKNVGGGQNMYRNIHEALKGSSLTDTIINLEGDVAISEPLVINPNIDIQIDGNKKWKLTSTHATTLCTLGNNQQLSFVNLKQIVGGKKVVLNGTSTKLSFIACGRYFEPNYVNVEMTSADSSSRVYLAGTTLFGTSAPAIKISDVDPGLIVDRSIVKGATNHPAIKWTVDGDNKFKAKFATFIHGSGDSNSPLEGEAANDVSISMYNCGMNASFDANNFTNTIVNASLTVDSSIDF